jgi:hypothetical protein
MTRRLSDDTFGRTLALQMLAAEPARDRRHEVLRWSVVFVGVFAVLGLLAILIHKIADKVLM